MDQERGRSRYAVQRARASPVEDGSVFEGPPGEEAGGSSESEG